MSQAARNAGVSLMHPEKMICVECFRTKGDADLKLPCQNPRCHFYLCTPIDLSPCGENNMFQTDTSSSFNKEVGYNRKTKRCFGINPSQMPKNNKMWGYRPSSPVHGHLSVPQVMIQKTRSKSASATSSGNNMSIRKILSGSILNSKDVERMKMLHSHTMSLPEYADSLLMQEGLGELVEDTFVSSPLPDYGERVEEERRHFGTPDTDIDIDSGISSPFGRPSTMLDSLDCPSTKVQSQSIPVTSAPPSISLASGSSNTFDMTQLRMEMTKTMNSQVEQSLAINGRGSPESVDQVKFSICNATTILGMSGLTHCSDTYSRKVFIGGLPPDTDEDDIRVFFMRFGSLTVDWPHKNHSKVCIPPKGISHQHAQYAGYAFVLFKNESSVHKLLISCIPEGEKYFIYMPSSNLSKKKVQVRPWYITDSYYPVNISKPIDIDPRKAVFVGGVPRPLKASELAHVMNEKYGNVAFIVIDSDNDLKYPKGAACVVFSSHSSYIAAVSARFMQLSYGSLDKKVEIKPYVLDGQMCDECNGVQCTGKPAPFFCGSVTCLQYYCEYCWATVHSMPGRQNHRPLLKDIGDKARFY